MLTTTRRFAKSWVAYVLLGLLIVSLAVVGTITDPFRNLDFSNAVIKAGDREVSQPQFRGIVDRFNEQRAEQTGQRFTMQELVDTGGHIQLMEQLAGEEGLFAWIWRVGLRPAEQLVADRIRETQAFFDPVTGQFDEAAMAQLLADNGLTPAEYEADLRDQVAAEHYAAGVAAGMRLPRVYGALLATYEGETRNGRYILLSPEDAGTIPDPTDAQLTALLNEVADQVRRPELRTATLVRFTPSQAASGVEVTDAEIAERFQFARDSLGTPETRSFVTLTAPNAQAAQGIVRRLRAGEDPAAVARSLNIEPVTYSDQPRSAVADSRVAAAAFGLQSGAVSDPVQGDLGLVVIKLTEVTAGQQAQLADHRAEIEEAIRLEKARARVSELVERFVQLREGGASLTDAAEQAGGEVIIIPPFTEQGALGNGQSLPPTIAETAWATAEGADSDIVDAGNDEYFALRVTEVTPARMPTVDELRGDLTTYWRNRELGRRLQERGNAIAERIRGGEDIAAVARAEGLTLTTREGIGRQPVEGEGALGQGILEGLFGQGRGQVFSGPADQEGRFVVGVVDRIAPPVAAVAGRQVEQLRLPMTAQAFQQEILPAIQAGARQEVDVRTYPDRAALALGVTPPEEGAEGAAEAPAEGGAAQ